MLLAFVLLFILACFLPICVMMWVDIIKKVKNTKIDEARNKKAKKIAAWLGGITGFLWLLILGIYSIID
ncbi:SNF family Na+-dependent transporter [Croceifilum oryzae]|uniref:SNF family Na+-dependent transporter n=1 Tax=Croceifilum oryzae TaxID=1553429 RepID=A0AAJ1WSW0_9BACL|nr:SNF family Na+-dependent transporter [Croceifilum oryzae]